MKKQKVLIDTDMGYDDIMAILMLLSFPVVKILGFTLVKGVSRINYGFKNLSRILNFLDLNIPIIKGVQSAKSKVNFPTKDIQRAKNLTLLKDLKLPAESRKNKFNFQNTENFINSLLKETKITIIALGPLTNIARLITKYPKNIGQIKQIMVMGGGIKKGNVPPLFNSEYNIRLDPKSANIVFNSTIPITLVGIDAANFVPATKKFQEKVSLISSKNKTSKIIKEIIFKNQNDFSFFYDPLAISLLIDKKILKEKRKGFIQVIQKGKKIGTTLFSPDPNGNIEVVLEVFSDEFYNLVEKTTKGEKL